MNIGEYNQLLELYNQKTRIISSDGKILITTSGKIISDNEYSRWDRALKRKCDTFFANFDLYDSIMSENDLISFNKKIRSLLGKKYANYNPKPYNPNRKSRKGIPTGVTPWNKGKTKYTDERLSKLSRDHSGSGNPSFNRIKTIEEIEKQSNSLKKTIKNGYTPVNNRNTHWEVKQRGRSYRSSWELLFHLMNPSNEYEKLRIDYYDTENGENRIYIVDFIDYENKIVTEIKPICFLEDQITKDKLKSLRNWCTINGYTLRIFTEDDVRKIPIEVINQVESDKLKERLLNENKKYQKNR